MSDNLIRRLRVDEDPDSGYTILDDDLDDVDETDPELLIVDAPRAMWDEVQAAHQAYLDAHDRLVDHLGLARSGGVMVAVCEAWQGVEYRIPPRVFHSSCTRCGHSFEVHEGDTK